MNENLAFGLALTVVGMAGTVVSLWLLSLIITTLKKLFPPNPGS